MDSLTYSARIGEAKSERDYYDLSIDLGRFATPQDIAWLATDAPISFQPFRQWLKSLHADIVQDNPRIEPYKHTQFSTAVSLYSAGGDRSGKCLLIAFSTGSHDLAAPVSLFLQYFSADHFDVLVLRDWSGEAFESGVPGYATPFKAAVSLIASQFEIERYASIRCCGVSNGGIAALAAGILLKASLSVSFCGLPLNKRRRSKQRAVELERILKNGFDEPNRAIAVYPEDHKVDRENANALAQMMALRLVAAPGIAHHNIFKPLLRAGMLADFMKSIGLNTL